MHDHFKNGWMVELLQLSKPIARCNGIHHHAPKEQTRCASMSSIQGMTSCTRKALVLGSLPDGKAEGDLVDEICKVVDEVQAAVIDTTHEVAKEVAAWVNLLADPSSPATDPASPPKISKRMKNHPHMPPAKPTQAPPGHK